MTVVAADIMLISSEVVGIATRQTTRRGRRPASSSPSRDASRPTSCATTQGVGSRFDCQEPAPRAAVRTYAWR